MKNKIMLFTMIAVMLVQFSSFALAEELEDFKIFGLEAEKLFNFGSGLLAIVLFALTGIAYKRTKRKKLAYVSLAFMFFAVKGILMSTELFLGDWAAWIDPVASFLDFAILLSFFFGVTKK
jgi:hypothetical protein